MKGLYDRGLDREAVRRLFRLIDGMLTLPPVEARQYRANLERFAQENQVPFITQTEQAWLDDGRIEAYRKSIRVPLRIRFGQAGLALVPRVEKLDDPAALEAFLNAIADAPDLAALEALLPPG